MTPSRRSKAQRAQVARMVEARCRKKRENRENENIRTSRIPCHIGGKASELKTFDYLSYISRLEKTGFASFGTRARILPNEIDIWSLNSQYRPLYVAIGTDSSRLYDYGWKSLCPLVLKIRSALADDTGRPC